MLCSLAELIYHHSGGDAMRDGVTWLGRQRASLSACLRTSTSSLDPGMSTSAARRSRCTSLGLTSPTVESAADSSATLAGSAECASAAAQPASRESSQSIRRTSPTGARNRTSPTRARIRASLAGMWGVPGGAVLQSTSVDRPIRRMRLRDQLELPQEMIDGTVLYLSPHYRLLPASGMSVTGVQSSMYMELSAQLGSLGFKVVSATSLANQPGLFLLVLCPGFFSCPELVEETAHALKGILKRSQVAGFGSCGRLFGDAEGVGGTGGAELSTEDSLSSECSWQEEGSLRLKGLQRQHSFGSLSAASQFSGRFSRKPRVLMPLMSTAMPYGEYARTCPPDLKDLGLFEANFDLWPESAALQPTAIKIAVLHLPGNQHAARHPSRMNAAATRDSPSGPQLKLQQLAMSRRPQQAERVVAGGEALERRQHRHGQLRLPPRAAAQRVWLGAEVGSEHDGTQRAAEHDGALGHGVIGDSGPAGEGAPVGQALQRARSHARRTLQNVAKDVPGSSSSHAVGTEAGAEVGAEAEAVGSGPSPGPFPLRPSLLRMPEVGVAVGIGGGVPQAARSGSSLAAQLAVSDATPLPASPPPSDRAAKRTSSIAANRQQQLNVLMALEEGSSCHSSDQGEHVARASSHLDEDFGDPPEEEACSRTSSRLSVGQAVSSPI